MKPDRIIRIKRVRYEDKQTLGNAIVMDGNDVVYTFLTLELAWKDNKKRESCIPTGIYDVVKRNSPKYGDHFHVLDVPERDMILVHRGNYYTDILGCVLPGDSYRDLNKDGYVDVLNSKATMKRLVDLMPDKFKLEIQ